MNPRKRAVLGTAIGLILIGVAALLGVLHLNSADPSGGIVNDPPDRGIPWTPEQIVYQDLVLEGLLADPEFQKRDLAGFNRAQRDHVKIHNMAREAAAQLRTRRGP